VSRARPALLVLAGAVGLVLLIACANVTSLLTAEGLAREKEAAVRHALGASRARLLGHWLAEDLVLSLAGGLGGLALARLGVSALVAVGPEGLPRLQEIAVGPRSTIFTLVLAVLAGTAAGLVPALRSSRPDVATSLKHGARVAGAGRHRLHDGLVVGELAMAMVLLVGAGLLARSFVLLQRPDPGFRADGLLTLTVSLSGSPRAEGEGRSAFLTDVADSVLGVPGVASAAFSNHLPVGGDTWRTRFEVEGRRVPEEELPRAVMRTVTPAYPRAMGLPTRGGRSFDDRDRAEGRPVVLVNEALVRRCWPGASPIGARLKLAGSGEPWRTVVGVVGDALQTGVGEPVQPEILFPYTQDPVAFYNGATLVVRTRSEPRAVAEAVKARVWAVAPELPITRVLTMREVLREAVTRERLDALLMGLVSGLALLLATVGIYGVTAYAVGRRAHEIAVRMALGARARQVAAMVVAEGLQLGLRGLALGAVGALLLSRVLRGLLHDVSPTDPATYLAVGLLLVAVVVAACLVPALRAARVDPLSALRDE
jgi:putative ABC transport system permease protein